MPKAWLRVRKTVWATSICLAIAVLVAAWVMVGNEPLFDDFAFIAIIVAVFPPAILNHLDYRWKKSMDNRLPDLFRSVVRAQETGMTLPQALEEASKRDYGPLTPELKKIVNQMSWGLTFEEALQGFSSRVDTPLVKQTVSLIVGASHSGGHVEKIFSPMGSFIQTTLRMQKERRAQTRPYIAIIYVAFYVFVFTIILLFKTFFVQAEVSPIIGIAALSPHEAWRIFFHMSAIQAFFGGLVAGKMGEGSTKAGLKHTVILLVSGYAALKLMAW